MEDYSGHTIPLNAEILACQKFQFFSGQFVSFVLAI